MGGRSTIVGNVESIYLYTSAIFERQKKNIVCVDCLGHVVAMKTTHDNDCVEAVKDSQRGSPGGTSAAKDFSRGRGWILVTVDLGDI